MALPQPKVPFSANDFLAWDAVQTVLHEHADGEVFAMAGGDDRRATVSGNLFAALHGHLKGNGCCVYMNDVELQVPAANTFFYTDVFVTCSERDANNRLIQQEPLLVVEVLSPSTAAYDRGDKFASYRLCPTLAEYAVIDIDRRAVDLFRKNADGLWVLHPYDGDQSLTLECVTLTLPLGELFADLEGTDHRAEVA